jgi:hypothetical protein
MGAAAAAVLLAPAAAEATTFCVPGFHAACPDNGTNVAQANLETAMGTSGSDGSPDFVRVAPGHTHTDADSLKAFGSDLLTVTGGGPTTLITTSATDNSFVVDLFTGNTRSITVEDLTIRAPASFPDSLGNGAIAQVASDTFDNVDFVSANPASGGIASIIGGLTVRNSSFSGTGEGYIDAAVTVSDGASAPVIVRDTRIEDVIAGVRLDPFTEPTASITVQRTSIRTDPTFGQSGIEVAAGSIGISSSILEIPRGIPLAVVTDVANGSLDAEGVTVVDSDDANPYPLYVRALGAGHATMEFNDSIAYGFATGCYRTGNAGTANVLIDRSNIPAACSVNSGLGTLSRTNSIDADPDFIDPTGNYRLQAGSPSIDAGDPLSTLATDFEQGPRPQDGDGVGGAVVDQGAFERPAAPTPPDTAIDSGPATGAVLATTEATFAFHGTPPADTFALQCKLDGAAYTTCTSPKTFSGLSQGSHTVSVRAVDGYGFADTTPAARTFSVDTADPETTIDSGPGKRAKKGKPKFTFSSNENGSSFECSLVKKGKAAKFKPCTSPKKYKLKRKKKKTKYTFSVRATDAAERTDSSPASKSFKVKKKPRR